MTGPCLDGLHAEGPVAEDVAAHIQVADTLLIFPAGQVCCNGWRTGWECQHCCLQQYNAFAGLLAETIWL